MALARLTLLIGAHKTASTHLQQTLLAARGPLAAKGIGLISPRESRAALKPLYEDQPPDAPEQAAHAVAALCPGAAHVVLMEENIPGTTGRALLYGPRGALYPFAARRLQAVLALFPGIPARIGMAMRHQGTHLASCWAEELLHAPWQTFRHYARDIPVDRPQWAGLAGRLVIHAPLTLWRYEDHAAVLPKVIDWATGLPGLGASLPLVDGLLRAGPSDPAVRWLHKRMEEDPTRDLKQTFRRIRMKWPRPDHPPFQPWSPDEVAAFDTAYKTDLARLSALPGITLIQP